MEIGKYTQLQLKFPERITVLLACYAQSGVSLAQYDTEALRRFLAPVKRHVLRTVDMVLVVTPIASAWRLSEMPEEVFEDGVPSHMRAPTEIMVHRYYPNPRIRAITDEFSQSCDLMIARQVDVLTQHNYAHVLHTVRLGESIPKKL